MSVFLWQCFPLNTLLIIHLYATPFRMGKNGYLSSSCIHCNTMFMMLYKNILFTCVYFLLPTANTEDEILKSDSQIGDSYKFSKVKTVLSYAAMHIFTWDNVSRFFCQAKVTVLQLFKLLFVFLSIVWVNVAFQQQRGSQRWITETYVGIAGDQAATLACEVHDLTTEVSAPHSNW